MKLMECHPRFVTHSSLEWVGGDPIWSRVYAAVRWVGLLYAGLLSVLLVLNFLWLAGAVASLPTGFLFLAMPSGMLWLWAWLGPSIALTLAALVLPTRRAVFAVAPTDRGLAIRALSPPTRVIPWTNLWWPSATRFEWRQRLRSVRATVTWEQYQRIYRWFHPSD